MSDRRVELESRLQDLATEFADILGPTEEETEPDDVWANPVCTGLVLCSHWIDLSDTEPNDPAHFIRFTKGAGIDRIGLIGLLTVALDTAREL